jgi:hypothetical protein
MDMRLVWISALALLAVSPGHAQTVVSTQAATAAEPAASPNPNRLAAARRIADKLLPDGSYRKMMDGTLDQMIGGISKQFLNIPARDIAGIAGIGEEQLSQMGSASLREIATIMDPAFEERMGLISKTMMPDLIDMMSKMEPQVRDGLTEAYAARFDQAQLTELDAFFATPTGTKFAGESMLIYTDPAVLSRMEKMMPEMMKAMPAMMQKVMKAGEALPKPKTIKQLSQAERNRLAALLGVPSSKLK